MTSVTAFGAKGLSTSAARPLSSVIASTAAATAPSGARPSRAAWSYAPIAAVLLVVGSLLCLLATIGLLRFGDVFARMHAASKAGSLGLILVMAGAGIRLGGSGGAGKLLLVAVFQLLTAPVATHLIGRAAYRAGDPLSSQTVLDELDRPPTPG